jgi:membrane-associated protease RseP (regulator of RpoE activity)
MKKTMPPGADPLSSSRASHMPEPDEAALAQAMKEPEFKRFVEAQLTWDRAMAEALASAKRKFSNATVVGILGSGHVADGHGVPHQLKELGVTALTTLIPVSTDEACTLVGTSYADAVFILPRSEDASAPERPRLGVFLTQGDGAPRINQVAGSSVAEAAGLRAGDHIVRAAGLAMRNPDDLVEIVGRQAPGTWLPLSIRRDGQEIDLIAKFPTRPRQDR